MPFLIAIQVRDSLIEGKGIYALQDIPKDTVCWTDKIQNSIPVVGHNTESNILRSKEQLLLLPPQHLESVLNGGSYIAYEDKYMELRDGAQFTNHSDDPNNQVVYPASKDFREIKSIATRDIKASEEITENYNKYPFQWPQWLWDYMEKYCPHRMKFQTNMAILKKQ